MAGGAAVAGDFFWGESPDWYEAKDKFVGGGVAAVGEANADCVACFGVVCDVEVAESVLDKDPLALSSLLLFNM